jgi:hypothetical protein
MHLYLTAGISKKLVTIFASHRDSFIMTQNLLPFNNFDKPGLQKLRQGVLPAGTLRYAQGFWLKYGDR